MWKKIKKLSALMMAAMMLLGVMGTGNVVYATESGSDSLIEELGSKTSTELSQGRYEITVSVPGAESEKYNEIILMVDASGSQLTNMEEVRNTILDIGEHVLNEYGTMHLTLMHFGIAGGTLFTATTMDELENLLADTEYEDLKRWPTATNCEASFVHLQEYIAASPNLQNAYIMYTSDGETNLSEEAKVWYDWKNHPEWYYVKNYTQIIENALTEEEKWIDAGEGPSAPTKAIFGDILEKCGDDTAALKSALETEVKANDYELGKKWVDKAWEQAYDGAGLEYNTAYPIGVIEKAFIKVHGMERAWHWVFAYTTLGYSRGSAEDYHSASGASYTASSKGHRAAAEANELAAMDQVEKLYLIGMGAYGSRKTVLTSWMNASEENKANKTANVFAEHEKITFIDGTSTSADVNALLEVLKDLGEQLSQMPMNDVYVVDPMSKWVNLETDSIRIYDGDTCIWNVTEGWLVENPPVGCAPITLDKDPVTGYDRITWKVKDGALLSSDSYSMRYYVTVNKEAEGFVEGKLYPANDPTTVHYTDENNQPQEEDIEVPLVKDGENTDTERIINITKSTVIKNTDGTTSTYALEGIVFDVYYLCTVDEYTANITKYENPTAALVEGKQPVETLTTDITGKASYNLTKDGQPDGIYLIIEHEHPAIVEPLAPFLVAVPMTSQDGSSLIYTIDLQPKNEILPGPDVDKDITSIGQNSDTVSAGDNHTWIIRGGVPADVAKGKEYTITDTLDYQLTYAGDTLSVKLGLTTDEAGEEDITLAEGTDYTLTTTKETVDADESEETVREEVVDKIVVSLTTEGMAKIGNIVGENYENYEIRVYFDAYIDEDGQVGVSIPNKAELYYKNSVGFEFDVESDEPYVYTCGINIVKYNAKDENELLSGAVFKLARKATEAEIAAGNYNTLVTADNVTEMVVYLEFYDKATLEGSKVNSIITQDGKAMIYGLEAGDYYLVEIKAPEGYNLLSYPVSVTLNQESHMEANSLKVANSNTFVLPTTGGIGTSVFTLIGGLMTLAGGTVLVRKKKEEN